MRPDPRCVRLSFLLGSALLVALGGGCGDGIEPPRNEPEGQRIWSGLAELETAAQCQKDPLLLAALRDPDHICQNGSGPCEQGSLSGATCLEEACSEFPNAVCDPALDFRCAGRLSVSPTTCGSPPEDCCPSGFALVAGPPAACIGNLPRLCNNDSECPDGSYCDATRGGICWWDCTEDDPAPESSCPKCDCDGRCRDEDGTLVAPLDAPSAQRPIAVVYPDRLVFEPESEGIETAQRVRLNVHQGGFAEVDMLVIAPLGMVVSCPDEGAFGERPVLSSFGQSCVASFGGLRPLLTGFWVMTHDAEIGLVRPTEVLLRWAERPENELARVVIDSKSESAAATLAAGWYEGSVVIDGLQLLDAESSFSAIAAGESPAAVVQIPVKAWVCPDTASCDHGPVAIPHTLYVPPAVTPTRVVLVDEARLLSPSGLLDLQYFGHPNDETGLPVSVVGGWLGGDSPRSLRAPSTTTATPPGTTHPSTIGFDTGSSGDTLLRWDADSGELTGLAGLVIAGIRDEESGATDLIRPNLRLRFSLRGNPQLTGAAPIPPEIAPQEDAPQPSEWLAFLGPAGSPASLRDGALAARFLPPPKTSRRSFGSLASCFARLTTEPRSAAEESCRQMLPGTAHHEACHDFATEFLPEGEQDSRLACCHGCEGMAPGFSCSACDPASVWPRMSGPLPIPEGFSFPFPAEAPNTLRSCAVDPVAPTTGTETDRAYFEAVSCAQRAATFQPSSNLAVANWWQIDAGGFLLALDSAAPQGDLWTVASPPSSDLESLWYPGPNGSVDLVGEALTFPFDGADGITERDFVEKCINDLSRRPSQATPLSGASDSGARARVAGALTSQGCVDIARFDLEQTWLAEAAKLEHLDGRPAHAQRLFQRRFQQWLDVHGTVSRHIAESARPNRLADLQRDDPRALSITTATALDLMERGAARLIYGPVWNTLTQMDPEALAQDNPPREGWRGEETRRRAACRGRRWASTEGPCRAGAVGVRGGCRKAAAGRMGEVGLGDP